MKLYLLGINHLDPQVRGSINLWMERKQLRKRGAAGPAFVATEWDDVNFPDNELRRQRTRLSEQLAGKSPELIRVLVDGLGYEADAHLDRLPHVETVYLDRGLRSSRKDKFEIGSFADGRLITINQFLQGQAGLKSTEAILRRIGLVARRKGSRSLPRDTGRDAIWADMVGERAAGKGKWAVVICGAAHLKERRGTLRSRLKEMGQDHHVKYL